mgnify:CR=1 FL=1
MPHVRWIGVVALPLLAACADERITSTAPDAVPPSFRAARGDDAEPIPGQYIVTLRDDAPEVAAARGRGADAMRAVAERVAARRNARVERVYGAALRGFAAKMTDADARALARDPEVELVEQDQVVRKSVTQTGATWGLDRIDQRTRPLNGSFTYTRTGAGTTVYIVDTGINPTHVEFTGRLSSGFTSIADGRGTTDCDGHGTHVAGTVGGTVYGVAKGATLVPVRVLDCNGSGSWSGVIAGIDWVASQQRTGPEVANLSLGGGASTSVDNAVANAVSRGVVMVVAAGNSNRDACNFSPARTGSAITVGATTSSDARASYSNFGRCLDVFAPGSSITSAWIGSNSATLSISGTSMASPHVAGVAALYLQGNASASPTTVRNALVAAATANVVTSAGRNSPNLLLFTNY